ncbi:MULTISPECIES: hypothetical protein [Sorangium]|uniref:Secreted protein n=1 Tax=Sorangium cellulosum TaxID=56 RepID=A0A4P2QNR1_SORCE|nr:MULTISPECIES: hypothetical protein [Sorangium]AUX31759.1 uncharacterized protein SOCE836_038910 [Sorangium cellulosum]WCQ91138.1 hypothetical protein NQZ70_03853 [Sorangium sp. Soce836]
MQHRRFAAWALAASGGLTAIGASSPSSACTPLPGIYISDVPSAVPLDGVIVARVYCGVACPTGPVLVVKDKEAGAVIAGAQEVFSFEPVGAGERLLVFRPAAPLIEGHTYTVATADQDMHLPVWELVASADLDMDVGAIPVEVIVTVHARWHGEPICCTLAAAPGSCGPQESCVAEEEERYAALDLRVAAQAVHGIEQYVQIVTFSLPNGTELSSRTVWGGNVFEGFDVAAPEYCYQLTYRSLADGTTIEKERSCIPHGGADTAGVFPIDAERLRRAIVACAAPPEGFERIWCAAKEERCTEDADACIDDDLSLCESIETGAGGSDGSGEGGSGGGAPAEPVGEYVIEGCSVSTGRRVSSGWTLSAVGLALAAAIRAGRRRGRC